MSNNFQQIIFQELELYFEPLLAAAEEPDEIFTLFDNIGWDLYTILGPDNGPFIQAIQDIANGMVTLTGFIENPPEDFADLKEGLDATFNLINGVRNLDSFVVDSVSVPENLGNLVKHLFQYLTALYIYRRSRLTFHFLELLTLIRLEKERGSLVTNEVQAVFDSEFPIFDFSRIPDLLTAPHELFAQEYWPDGFTDRPTVNKIAQKLFRRIANILVEIGINAHMGGGTTPEGVDEELYEKIKGVLNISKVFYPPGTGLSFEAGLGIGLLAETEGGPGVYLFPFGELTFDYTIGEWVLTLNVGGAAGGLEITGNGLRLVLDPDMMRLEAGLELNKQVDEAGLALLVGSKTGTRFEIARMGFGMGLAVNSQMQEYTFFSKLDRIKFVFSPGDGDGFLQKVLSEDGFIIEFDLKIGYSNISGFHFKGSGGLEIRFAPHLQIGPFEIQGLLLALKIQEDGSLALIIGASVKLELGPFVAVVEEMGLRADMTFPDSGGNLGPVNFDLGFKPPSGVGLSLDVTAIRGGGYLFFDFENERYGGALELSVIDLFSVTAIALITTRFPDGSKGFSLLLIISVEFTPGITLGMGFFLSGLGGMIGINRTIDVEAMRDGVKNNTIDHILFPENVVANITQIIEDLRAIFPPKRDQFVIGVMAKITYSTPTILSIELGVIIEFANPIRIAILGVLKAILPEEEEPVLTIQVNFLGIIDFEKGELSFDASLYNSKLLTFSLEGDMAIRLRWKKPEAFLLSVGGFHPSFEPPNNLSLRPMKRITLTISPDNPRIVLTNYFAITSNTVQFGADIDIYYFMSGFKVVGYLGYDVLFQFSPFRFMADARGNVEVKSGNNTLVSIQLVFSLTGPTPWIAIGTGSFKILFINFKVRISKTWGVKKEAVFPPIAVLPKVVEAFEQDKNWQEQLPARTAQLVSRKTLEEVEGNQNLFLQTFSSLRVRQNIAPLNIELTKFGNFRPSDVRRIRVHELLIGNDSFPFDYIKETFAPASFKNMADKDKLKAPSYQEENSGIVVTGTDRRKANYAINREVRYEVRSSDHDPNTGISSYLIEPLVYFNQANQAHFALNQANFVMMAENGAVGRSELGRQATAQQFRLEEVAVQLQEEKYAIVNNENLTRLEGDFVSGSQAEATDVLNYFIGNNPEMKGQLSIVPEYELEG